MRTSDPGRAGAAGLELLAQRHWDTHVWYASTERIARDLRWTAVTSIDEGLRRTAATMAGELAPTAYARAGTDSPAVR